MKTIDDDIKKVLQDNIQRINDNSFTDRILTKHLADKKSIKNSVFMNFLPMIIGLSTLILGIGLVALIRQNNDWINEIGFTENHGLIILTISIIFLIYKLIEEFTAPNTQYSQ
jgi:predicted neutral ceramidase superfamily lipid hydrolase